VIKQLASIIGPGHQVDLRNYDLLVVVEIFKVGGSAAMQFPKTTLLT
jgi:tRNA acetyltransferase TAN1